MEARGLVTTSDGIDKVSDNLTFRDLKAMDSYDEDLNENPFFQSLVSSCPALFSQCVQEKWLICVPRRDSLPKYAFTLEDFTHHILRPYQSSPQKGLRSRDGNSDTNSSYSSNSTIFQPQLSFLNVTLDDFSSSSLSSSNEALNETSTDKLRQRLKGNWNYKTLANVNVEYMGRMLILDVEVPVLETGNDEFPVPKDDDIRYDKFVQLRKEVLFEETFYTCDRQKYKVLCVASPLNSKVDLEDNAFGNSGLGIWNLTSLRDCIDFIWVKGNFKVLETYDAYIKLFLHNHSSMESLPLSIQRNLVATLYTKCVEYAMLKVGVTTHDDSAPLSKFILDKLQLATETYVINGIYRVLISSVTSVTAPEDSFFNKITRNLCELQPQDVNIDTSLWYQLSKAKHELGRLNSFSSPLGKLSCLKRAVRHLRNRNSGTLTSDELIPIMAYLIVKNPLGNWSAQLEFLRNFRFSSEDKKDQESDFYLTTLEAAMEFLKSGKLLEVSENERDVGAPCDFGETWLFTLHKEIHESNNPQLADMLELVRRGDCQRLAEAIEEYEYQRQVENSRIKEPEVIDSNLLCHPLCDCPNCTTLCKEKSDNDLYNMPSAVDLCTEEGLNLLHLACIYGRPKIVDLLISYGSFLEAKDYQGMTALHFAASRGHQNALLLLLHAGADVQPENNMLNTPLHLAAQNGHTGCVKALVYYSEHARLQMSLSARNAKGDTPLHFAARWGYKGIVSILAEHGASINIPNVRHATPIDCAHDIHILRLLQRSLRKRSLIQTNHGDFINIELMDKEEGSGVVMLISEPKEEVVAISEDGPEKATSAHQRRRTAELKFPSSTRISLSSQNLQSLSPLPGSKLQSTSVPSSRRSSFSSIPPLSPSQSFLNVPTESLPRSRRSSGVRSPFSPEVSPVIIEESDLEAMDTKNERSCSRNSAKSSQMDVNDEQMHLRTVQVEHLTNEQEASRLFHGMGVPSNSDHDIRKLFTSIVNGDTPLALFYLGIPPSELSNPENDTDEIGVISSCHPLCLCERCVAKHAGLGLSLDVKNSDGLSALHLAVQYHNSILVKVLIRYGANLNLKSDVEKKTALDFAMNKGYTDIENILAKSGASSSDAFSPGMPIFQVRIEECEN